MADDLRTLQAQLGRLMSGQSVDTALSLLIAETARVLLSTGRDPGELRPLTAAVVQQLQGAIAKGHAIAAKAGAA